MLADVAGHVQLCQLWWRAQAVGCTIPAFADRAGVEEETMRSWLVSETGPSFAALLRLQMAFGGESPLQGVVDDVAMLLA
ncbi:MAG: hypothetical protein LBE25_09445 [Arthrobacter sp.]|nr:hypothetical protein [Arthrobacter sp.]